MTEITITIEPGKLRSYTDEFLATAWHVVQANPAPIDDKEAGRLAEYVGREIIRRWLRSTEPAMWHHQGSHYPSTVRSRFAKWNGEDWVAKTEADGPDVVHLAIHGKDLPVACKRPTGKRTTWGADVTCPECNEEIKPKDGDAR